MPEPIVSIVVPTYRRAELLASCLDSIARTALLPHEVICVTVADDEPTQALLAARPEVRNIAEERRTGFVRAANRGFHAARGRYLAQINDDCVLMPHTIANAVRFLEAPPHRGRIGQAAFFHDTPVRRNVHQQIEVEGVRYAVLHVRGLCYANFGLAERSLCERLGFYDERFHMYGADPDFSLKVWHEARLEVAPCPGALIRHLEHADDRAAAERPAQPRDNELLFAKWGL